MTSKIYTILLTTLLASSISACGGGSSSSNTDADVSQECVSVISGSGASRYINSCDFSVSVFYANTGNASVTGTDIAPNELLALTSPGIELTILRVCRSPSVASRKGCS